MKAKVLTNYSLRMVRATCMTHGNKVSISMRNSNTASTKAKEVLAESWPPFKPSS